MLSKVEVAIRIPFLITVSGKKQEYEHPYLPRCPQIEVRREQAHNEERDA